MIDADYYCKCTNCGDNPSLVASCQCGEFKSQYLVDMENEILYGKPSDNVPVGLLPTMRKK